MIIRADILIMSVLHAESSRYGAKLYKAQPFIQMSGMHIACHNRIELQHAVAVGFALHKTVQYQLFTDVQSPAVPAHRIAGIADMTAASHVVGMQDVKTVHFSGFRILCHGAVGLSCKKFFSRFCIQKFFLRKGYPVCHHFIPNSYHFG